MDRIREFVRDRMDLVSFAEDSSKVRNTLITDAMTNRRIEYCAARLGFNKSELMNVLIKYSLGYVEEELGVAKIDESGNNFLTFVNDVNGQWEATPEMKSYYEFFRTGEDPDGKYDIYKGRSAN